MLSTDTFKLDDLEEGDFSLDDITPNTTNAIKTSDSSNKQLSASTALLTSSDPNLARPLLNRCVVLGMDYQVLWSSNLRASLRLELQRPVSRPTPG